MQLINDGFSSMVRLVDNGGTIVSLPIRYIQLTHFVLENQQHTLRHNQQIEAHFNFVLDGRMTCLRFKARVKLDNLHGIGLYFEHDSILRKITRRLIKAESYGNPCHYLTSQSATPTPHFA